MTTTEQLDQQHQEDLQRLRGFRLLDDDFLTKCFEGDPKYIQLVLQIVLEMPDLVLSDVRTQVFVENLLNRSVRLDILATDSTGRKINVEIQRADKGAGRKRARYNSSMMDANLLRKGEDFDKLPETYVVFITEHDVLGDGRSLYKIERYISGSSKKFEDGSHILYVNRNSTQFWLYFSVNKRLKIKKKRLKQYGKCRKSRVFYTVITQLPGSPWEIFCVVIFSLCYAEF